MNIIIIAGLFNVGFGIFHLFFWKIFHWKDDLAKLTHINRGIMQILNLCLTFVFFAMAYACFSHTQELTATSLGKTLLVSFSLFWFLRAIEQAVFFGVKHKISLGLTLVFMLGGLIHLLPVIGKL